jgi:hypothetical protein
MHYLFTMSNTRDRSKGHKPHKNHHEFLISTGQKRLDPKGEAIRTQNPKTQRSGGARRDRTDDLKLAKLPLSQLSYGPLGEAKDEILAQTNGPKVRKADRPPALMRGKA